MRFGDQRLRPGPDRAPGGPPPPRPHRGLPGPGPLRPAGGSSHGGGGRPPGLHAARLTTDSSISGTTARLDQVADTQERSAVATEVASGIASSSAAHPRLATANASTFTT